MLPDDSMVMAAAWHPDGEAESFAIDATSNSATQSQMQSLSLFERRRNGSSAVFLLAPPTLEPEGVVLSLCYSPNGEYLLAARTNRNRGLVQVWKTLSTDNSDIQAVHEPIAWRMLENPIHDVLWTGQDTFVVCGDAGLSLLYQVDGSQHQASEAQVSGSAAMRGLISQLQHTCRRVCLGLRPHRLTTPNNGIRIDSGQEASSNTQIAQPRIDCRSRSQHRSGRKSRST